MKYFLDTDTCIYFLNDRFPHIQKRFSLLSPDEIKVPSIVAAELLFGARKSVKKGVVKKVENFLLPLEIIPFNFQAAKYYAKIRYELEKKGTPIGPNDLIVAATVTANAGVLVSNNLREFERIPNLMVENWAINSSEE